MKKKEFSPGDLIISKKGFLYLILKIDIGNIDNPNPDYSWTDKTFGKKDVLMYSFNYAKKSAESYSWFEQGYYKKLTD